MRREGFIFIYKPLQSKEIRNRIGEIPPKVPPFENSLGIYRCGGEADPSHPQQDTEQHLTIPLCPRVWESRNGSKRGGFVLSRSVRCRCSNVLDRKSTRLNSSHLGSSYAGF